LTYSLGHIEISVIIMSSYYLFRAFLVIFLGLLRGSNKEEGDVAYKLIKAYITLCFNNILFIRVLSKDK
jgi:hypothetical protein